jgi:hypothetical protein
MTSKAWGRIEYTIARGIGSCGKECACGEPATNSYRAPHDPEHYCCDACLDEIVQGLDQPPPSWWDQLNMRRRGPR